MQTPFYQTTEFLQHIAIITVLLIVFLLLFSPRLFKMPPLTGWQSPGDYYAYLMACIQTCKELDELNFRRNEVEGFYYKTYSHPVTHDEMETYYDLLTAAIIKRRQELSGVKATN